MSKFQRDQQEKLDEDIEKLIILMTGFVPSQKNFEIATKYASSNLKYHRFADPDQMSVQSKLDGILVKLQVMCKPAIADFLNELFQALKKCPLKKDFNDIPHKILDFLLHLSSNIIEVNQTRQPNYKVLEHQVPEAVSVCSVDSLVDWEFEESSEEEQSDEEIVVEVEQQTTNPEQECGLNILWHLPPAQKRSYTDLVSYTDNTPRSYQLFRPEHQNAAQMIFQPSSILFRNIVASEKDLVAAILLSLQGVSSQLICLKNEQFQLMDVDIPHMSNQALRRSVAPMLELADILAHLRKPRSAIEDPSLARVEVLIQEKMWIAIQDIIMQVDQFTTELLSQIVYHCKEFESEFHESITLIVLDSKLQQWQKVVRQINVVVLQLKFTKQACMFSSATLQLLHDCCVQYSLQSGPLLIYFQQIFIAALDPYLMLIDKYLDYNSNVTDSFEDVPKFLEPCVTELRSIGLAYKIFMKVQVPALTKIQFRDNFIKKFTSILGCPTVHTSKYPIEELRLTGGFQHQSAFTFDKITEPNRPEVATTMQSLRMINNPQFIKIFQKEFNILIRQEDQQIQNTLLNYLRNTVKLMDALKFIRILYFFERADVMQYFIEKIADSQTLARVKAIQNNMYDIFSENHIDVINFTLHSQPNPIFQISHRSVNLKVTLAHPLDLIINDNSIVLYNKIMQFLLFFKNSKLHLQATQADLKKYNKRSSLLSKLIGFSHQLVHFMQNYEYFLFVSIIQIQTNQFIDQLKVVTKFQQVIDLHTGYIKMVSDKMFLNSKSETILEVIYKILEVVQNFPTIVERALSLNIVDAVTQRIETQRIQSDFTQMNESFGKQMQALILIFDRNQRLSHAPEIIECIMKANFNRYYT